MLDYNPDNKLFLVKRVHIPNHVLEANAKWKDEQLAQTSQTESSTSITNKSQGSKTNIQEKEEDGRSSGSEGEAGPASDGEQKASQSQLPQQEVSLVVSSIHVDYILCTCCMVIIFNETVYTILCQLPLH